MRELLGRVSAIDPEAGAALRVISYFDALIEANAGLEATVRAASALAGCAVGILARNGRTNIRVEPDGRRVPGEAHGHTMVFAGEDGGTVWLERSTETDQARAGLDAVILERLARAATIILGRMKPLGRRVDPTVVEMLVDAGVDLDRRLEVAAQLGLAKDLQLAVVVSAAPGHSPISATLGMRHVSVVGVDDIDVEQSGQCAIGPVVTVAELPSSYDLARLAIRLTTAADEPGPTSLAAGDVLGLLALEPGIGSVAAGLEVIAIERAINAFPWALTTLSAVSVAPSLRAAATTLHVHHSTLQERVEHLNHQLTWDLTSRSGRTRLSIAMALRLFRQQRQ